MLGVVGFAVGENFNPLFDGSVTGPAINHVQQMPDNFWIGPLFAIALAEAYRISYGWSKPGGGLYTLREGYTPGDLGFDPFGLKPTDAKELMGRQTKELNNGRLAMVALVGLVAQELVTGEKALSF
jgi:light-harvesting complex I chlorophyll a/b binding protein 1